jgi:hypothetical protein
MERQFMVNLKIMIGPGTYAGYSVLLAGEFLPKTISFL